MTETISLVPDLPPSVRSPLPLDDHTQTYVDGRKYTYTHIRHTRTYTHTHTFTTHVHTHMCKPPPLALLPTPPLRPLSPPRLRVQARDYFGIPNTCLPFTRESRRRVAGLWCLEDGQVQSSEPDLTRPGITDSGPTGFSTDHPGTHLQRGRRLGKSKGSTSTPPLPGYDPPELRSLGGPYRGPLRLLPRPRPEERERSGPVPVRPVCRPGAPRAERAGYPHLSHAVRFPPRLDGSGTTAGDAVEVMSTAPAEGRGVFGYCVSP